MSLAISPEPFRRSSAVEQLTVNQFVVGSIPTAGANSFKALAELAKAFLFVSPIGNEGGILTLSKLWAASTSRLSFTAGPVAMRVPMKRNHSACLKMCFSNRSKLSFT